MRVIKLIFIAFFTLFFIQLAFKSEAKILNQNLGKTGYLSRIDSSLNEAISDYKVKKCFNIYHIDGNILKFCTADFNGNTSGFYDTSQHEFYIKDFNEYTVVHELFHATTMYYINNGVTDFRKPEVQENIAYDFENLLKQIHKISTEENYYTTITY